MYDEFISLPYTPSIPGLRFRHFRGDSDFPMMARAMEASTEIDKVEQAMTVEDIASFYAHLSNCDPYQDMILAEINGEVIGYSRGSWFIEENTEAYLYTFGGFLVPEWRRNRIGTAILHWMENRMREVSAAHPAVHPKFFQIFLSQHETARAVMLERSGYAPIRYFHQMVRPSLDDIPDFGLPDGLEVRQVLPEHYRLIWAASEEAFRDHWGYSQSTEEDYQAWLNDKTIFQPHLWQVAWDVESNQVAGQVRTFINDTENEKFGRRRGYTEFISVCRPWRKRGLARALIVRSLQTQKEQGMTESALGVDSENLSGATHVYEDCGFRVVKRNTVYRKPL